jgi:hypothetical protein
LTVDLQRARHNMFRLLPIDVSDIDYRSAEFNLNFTKKSVKRVAH